MFFEPQPWEMPFDGAILEGSTDRVNFHLDGMDVVCGLRVVLSHGQSRERGWKGRKTPWFFFPTNGVEGGLVMCGEDCTHPIFSRHPTDSQSLMEAFTRAWQKDKVARLFWLNESGTLRKAGEDACESLLVTASGVAVWHYYRRADGSSAFTWGPSLSSHQFAAVPALDVWVHLQHSLEAQEGEASFARRFTCADFDTKRAMVFKWKRGHQNEFKALLHDILVSYGVWDEAYQDEELELALFGPRAVEITFKEFWKVDVPPALLHAVERLCQWFEPFNVEIVNRRCVYDWMRSYRWGWEATAKRPNAHERLEAYLRWQEWLTAIEKRSDESMMEIESRNEG